MAVEQIVPTSEGATSNWTLAAGASKVAAVSLPDDDATTYINSGTTTATTQQFICANSIPSGSTITAIKIYARVKGNTQTVSFAIGYHIVGVATDEYTGHNQGSAAWGTDSWEFTGLSISYLAEEFRLYIRNTQARDLLCSSLYADVTYTPAGGGGGALTKQAAYYARLRSNT